MNTLVILLEMGVFAALFTIVVLVLTHKAKRDNPQ